MTYGGSKWSKSKRDEGWNSSKLKKAALRPAQYVRYSVWSTVSKKLMIRCILFSISSSEKLLALNLILNWISFFLLDFDELRKNLRTYETRLNDWLDSLCSVVLEWIPNNWCDIIFDFFDFSHFRTDFFESQNQSSFFSLMIDFDFEIVGKHTPFTLSPCILCEQRDPIIFNTIQYIQSAHRIHSRHGDENCSQGCPSHGVESTEPKAPLQTFPFPSWWHDGIFEPQALFVIDVVATCTTDLDGKHLPFHSEYR